MDKANRHNGFWEVQVGLKLTNLKDNLKRFSLDNNDYVARLLQAEDKRIAFVKLADRLHNMRTIEGHADTHIPQIS